MHQLLPMMGMVVSPSRYAVRRERRRIINGELRWAKTTSEVIRKIQILPDSLRATCILDIEEYLHTKCVDLSVQNPWWRNFNLKNLWLELQKNGLS